MGGSIGSGTPPVRCTRVILAITADCCAGCKHSVCCLPYYAVHAVLILCWMACQWHSEQTYGTRRVISHNAADRESRAASGARFAKSASRTGIFDAKRVSQGEGEWNM